MINTIAGIHININDIVDIALSHSYLFIKDILSLRQTTLKTFFPDVHKYFGGLIGHAVGSMNRVVYSQEVIVHPLIAMT